MTKTSNQEARSNQKPSFDHQKWLYEMNRQDAQRAHDKADSFSDQVNAATIKAGELTIRMTLLINGGAIIALLALITHLPKEMQQEVAGTLIWFAFGVGAAVVASAFSYFTNYSMVGIEVSNSKYWEHPYVRPGPKTHIWKRWNIFFHTLAVMAGLASIGTFITGISYVREAFTKLGH